jgi:hypothetical protein
MQSHAMILATVALIVGGIGPTLAQTKPVANAAVTLATAEPAAAVTLTRSRIRNGRIGNGAVASGDRDRLIAAQPVHVPAVAASASRARLCLHVVPAALHSG